MKNEMTTFQLGLYDYSGNVYGDLKPLNEVMGREDLPRLFEERIFRLTSAAFLFADDDRVHLSGEHFFGQLNLLVLQMEAALKRIAAGQTSLIRAANLNIEEGPFLALEPNVNVLEISFFYIDDSPFSSVYPVNGIVQGSSDELYAFFEINRHELLQPRTGTVFYSHLLQHPVSKDIIVNEFSRDTESARELYDLLDRPLDTAIYPEQMYE